MLTEHKEEHDDYRWISRKKAGVSLDNSLRGSHVMVVIIELEAVHQFYMMSRIIYCLAPWGQRSLFSAETDRHACKSTIETERKKACKEIHFQSTSERTTCKCYSGTIIRDTRLIVKTHTQREREREREWNKTFCRQRHHHDDWRHKPINFIATFIIFQFMF